MKYFRLPFCPKLTMWNRDDGSVVSFAGSRTTGIAATRPPVAPVPFFTCYSEEWRQLDRRYLRLLCGHKGFSLLDAAPRAKMMSLIPPL